MNFCGLLAGIKSINIFSLENNLILFDFNLIVRGNQLNVDLFRVDGVPRSLGKLLN